MSTRDIGRPSSANGTKFKSELDNAMKNDLRHFEQVPSYLQVNPYLRTGYRGFLSKAGCFTSIFTWTNETINIWSHLLGFVFFGGLLIYDVFVTIPRFQPPFGEIFVMIFLLVSCMICMACSAAYHTFCCHSEQAYQDYLRWDIAGIILAFAAVFISGIHYAFSCFQTWRIVYESIVSVLSVIVLRSQFKTRRRCGKEDVRTMVVFTLWAIFGFVPSLHWAFLTGGFHNPLIQNLLPRVGVMYLIIGAAFFFYLTKYPEKCFPGKVDYVGASHQLWHVLVVAAMFWWHQTGIKYAELKAVYGCKDVAILL